MTLSNSLNYASYELLPKSTPRPYQSKIIKDVTHRIAEIITSKAYQAKSLLGSTLIYPKLTSSLIEAATGSGKTSTIGFTLEQLWNRKNKLNTRLSVEQQFPNLNILVLNDRIGLVEQLRNELVHGSVDEDKKTIKQPILSNEFINNLAIKTYHSEADDDGLYKYNGSTEIEVDNEISTQATDSMHFATLQTAKTEAAHKLIGQSNIIIVDEADIVSMGANFAYGEYMETLMSYYVPDKHGNYPIILAMTATPDNITKDIFGEPTSRFTLAEYLASERGPEVQMYIETPPVEDETLIPSILADIQHAKTLTDHETKKQMIAEIGKRIDSLFPERKTPEQKEAYLERAVLSICDKIDDGERNMIFAESISDANYITNRINEIKGSQIAVARHSENPESVTDTMNNLKNGIVPTVVSVGQLIRGIDMPSVDNIFSLVDTASARKYIQLFGRGMRGKAVRFYDYGCSIENLARAGDIYTEYKEHRKQNNEQNKTLNGGTNSGSQESGGGLELYFNSLKYDKSNSHKVDLLYLIGKYDDLKLPQLGDNGRVMIEGVEHQRVGTSTPSEQLRGIKGRTALSRVEDQSPERKKQNLKQAKGLNGKPANVCNRIELKEVLKTDIEMPQLGDNGRVLIEGVEHQWVGYDAPSSQLWSLSGDIVLARIKNQSPERKKQNLKQAKGKSGIVDVCDIEALEAILGDDINMPVLGKNGKVTVKGVTFQWVGSNTPPSQLWSLKGSRVLAKIEKQSEKRKKQNLIRVRSKSRPVYACKRKALKVLLENDINMLVLGKNGRVMIKGVEHQWVGPKTPPSQLWSLKGPRVLAKIEKQSDEWKKNNLKEVRSHTQLVQVCNRSALMELLGI